MICVKLSTLGRPTCNQHYRCYGFAAHNLQCAKSPIVYQMLRYYPLPSHFSILSSSLWWVIIHLFVKSSAEYFDAKELLQLVTQLTQELAPAFCCGTNICKNAFSFSSEWWKIRSIHRSPLFPLICATFSPTRQVWC